MPTLFSSRRDNSLFKDFGHAVRAICSLLLVNVLQRPVQPWRLISASRNMETGRRTRPDRPARAAGTKVGPGRGSKLRDVLLLLRDGLRCPLRRAPESIVATAPGRSRRGQASADRQTNLCRLPAGNTPSTVLARTFEEVSIFSNFLNFFLKCSQNSYFLRFSQIFSGKWS